MEKRILHIVTNIGQIESNMSVEEAHTVIETAKKEGTLAAITCDEAPATLNVGDEQLSCINTSIKHLDMSEVKVFSYNDHTYTAAKEDEEV